MHNKASQKKHEPEFSHKSAISWLVSVSILVVFLLVVITSKLGPLALLLAILLLIIAVGVLTRRMPAFFAALKKPRPEQTTVTPSLSTSLPPQQVSRRTYLMLVGLNAYNQYRITINESPFTIGRDKKSSFVLDNETVSRTHLTITFNPDDKLCYVSDSSSNGTFLNNVKLPYGQKRSLHQGDSLQIAGIIFSVEYVHY